MIEAELKKASESALKRAIEATPITTCLRKKKEIVHGNFGKFVGKAMQKAIRRIT